MSEVKKIATRESYGNALVELGAEHDWKYGIVNEVNNSDISSF